jgi:cellulose biosynthesis protein BcsQ
LSQEEKRDVDDHDRHLEKYLRRRNINPPEFLQTTVIRVDSTKVESLYLAACSSRLQYVDSELMGLWGVDESSPDVRMLLRGTLHSPSIADKFDYILMDCPPRLSTAFVNALFACDGVLIPTILDVVSAQGVPHFLHSLKQLRLACPTLQVLGLLANRVQTISSAPVMSEADWLRWLPKKIRDAWGEPIQLFGTYVKRESALAHPNPKQMFASLDSGFQATFLDLEKELRDRIRAIQAPVSV